jgi:NAD-dependent dihydropyrimidine dehydrogenase PreA subunit
MNRLIYLKDVTTLRISEEKCIGCGMCVTVCPHEVLTLPNGKAQIGNRDACMECGACAQNCPVNAIAVKAGVGCAAAVINSVLGRKKAACCCVAETKDFSCETEKKTGSCC